MERDLLAARTALVTGGSGGIGRALAAEIAAQGHAALASLLKRWPLY